MSSESELRRKELLRETRRLYRDQNSFIPAVHPRYQRVYRELYPDRNPPEINFDTDFSQKKEETMAGFTTRLVIAALLFLGFLFLGQNQSQWLHLSSDQVVEMVRRRQVTMQSGKQWHLEKNGCLEFSDNERDTFKSKHVYSMSIGSVRDTGGEPQREIAVDMKVDTLRIT